MFYLFQERIRIGKELLEAKRIEEDNERKRLVSIIINKKKSEAVLFKWYKLQGTIDSTGKSPAYLFNDLMKALLSGW